MLLKAIALVALTVALPHPTNPPNANTYVGGPHLVYSGGPQREFIQADPFGDGTRTTILGWFDTAGVVRFYPAENPHLYNAPTRVMRTPIAGITRDPDGSLNGGLAVGALQSTTGESMTSNSAVGGEVYREAKTEEMERRRCTPDEPCAPDDDDDDPKSDQYTKDEIHNMVLIGLLVAVVLGIVVIVAKQK